LFQDPSVVLGDPVQCVVVFVHHSPKAIVADAVVFKAVVLVGAFKVVTELALKEFRLVMTAA
jgi:hypothetical protein